MFQPVESSVSFPKLEEEISKFWKQHGIYEKSLAARADRPAFVFYEGPPTANGLPHPGHCLTRAIKDLFPRYKTMRGFRCQRKAGWDTHGLPVEVEVCKELGIHSKEEIESYGVEPFIRKCVESVFRYTREWEQLTERLGFWIHLDEAYVTYHQSYVESVWWALKSLFDRGLLYQGHKIVWWWAQGGTALSAGEVGQGYREVADPSVFVRFPIIVDDKAKELGLDDNTSLLVWTTTPWTLPSNQFTAVKSDITYSLIVDPTDSSHKLIVAQALERTIVEKVLHGPADAWVVKKTFAGKELIGLRYKPPFDGYFHNQQAWGEGRFTYDSSKLQQLQDTGTTDLPEVEAKYRAEHWREFEGNGNCHWLMAWRVVGADFVTTESGTGLVHLAPAFGEDDAKVWVRERERQEPPYFYRPSLLNAVAPNGEFTDEGPEYCQGRLVFDCNKDINQDLKRRGLLFYQEPYRHEYPHCWRAEEDRLISYPRLSWFIRTTEIKDKMLANNSKIHWLPEHIRDGRFGNFLETNVDWALSRERYWGTPLPIWVCEKTGHAEAVGSYEELLDKPGITGTEAWEKAKRENTDLPDDLRVHKPYIDSVTYDSPKAPGARMRRVSEVIDCWFDSGAMPFAQWGYPHQAGSAERFSDQFPADFISEALDQTRGWFYSLLAISTLLFGEGARDEGRGTGEPVISGQWSVAGTKPQASGDAKSQASNLQISKSPNLQIPNPQSLIPSTPFPHPFRNCIVLGLMLGEDGGKMSKSKRNYRDPEDIFNLYGADALRWFFFANQPPWTSIRYSEQAIKNCIPEFLLRFWNVYSFFVIYANIDGFDPAARVSGEVGQLGPDVLATANGYRPIYERGELDRWILSELNRTVAAVVEHMDAYENFNACARLTEFVDALSNWYVRRSRDRYWSSEQSVDKLDAYWTLYECLLTTSKLIAPFVPFLAEAMWQNLAASTFGNHSDSRRPKESVHLCDYPAADLATIDEDLSRQMAMMREVVSLGRSARMGAKLKVRQPLSRVEVVLADDAHQPWLEKHVALIRDELNVKRVEFTQESEQYISYSVLPDLKRLGPRLGKRLPALRNKLAELDGGELLSKLKTDGNVSISLDDGPVELDLDDIQVRLQAKEGWAAAQGHAVVVVLATELTEELIREGLARELVRAIQDRRKEMGCEFTDRIEVGIATESQELRAAIEQFRDYIMNETLAVQLLLDSLSGTQPTEVKVAEHAVTLCIQTKRTA